MNESPEGYASITTTERALMSASPQVYLYERLAAPFDRTYKDPRGFAYVTGEQVISRLNEVLGPGGWTFQVREHGYDQESDTLWVLGRFEAMLDGSPTVREQFGSQQHNRRQVRVNEKTGERTGGEILDYGFDAKGAATDALKKCASLIGVALYLYEKDAPPAPAPAPAVKRPVASAPPPPAPNGQELVKVGSKLADRWAALVERAASLGLIVEPIPFPAPRTLVEQRGIALAAQIAAAQPTAQIGDTPPTDPTRIRLWRTNRDLAHEVQALGARPPTLRVDSTNEQIEAANAALTQQIADLRHADNLARDGRLS